MMSCRILSSCLLFTKYVEPRFSRVEWGLTRSALEVWYCINAGGWELHFSQNVSKRHVKVTFRQLFAVCSAALHKHKPFGLFTFHTTTKEFKFLPLPVLAADSSVGIAIHRGLDYPGIESRWWLNFPHPSWPALGHNEPQYNRYRDLPRSIATRGVVDYSPYLTSRLMKE